MFDKFDFSKMGELLSQAQKSAQELKEKNESKEFIAKSGGGLVKIKANGKGEILDVEIDDSLLDDKSALQILLISAVNDVLDMVKENLQNDAISLFGDM